MPQAPIDSYSSAARFLADRYKVLKKATGLTYAGVAERIGLSIGSVSLILRGKIPLQREHVDKFASVFDLTPREAKLLRDLNEFALAEDPASKQTLLRKLTRRKNFRDAHTLTTDQLQFLTQWQSLAIWELMDVPDFQPDPRWIGRRLRPHVPKAQVKEFLDGMVSMKLVKYDAMGRLTKTSAHILTPNEFHSEVVSAFHAKVADLARQAVADIPATERNFGVVVTRLNASNRAQWHQKLHDVRLELFALAQELQTSDGDEVVATVLQTFPVTHTPKSDASRDDAAIREGERNEADN